MSWFVYKKILSGFLLNLSIDKLKILFFIHIPGVVGQEPVLFRGTIFDNIAIGFPEATREEVQTVAEMAYAHDFITNLPNVSVPVPVRAQMV